MPDINIKPQDATVISVTSQQQESIFRESVKRKQYELELEGGSVVQISIVDRDSEIRKQLDAFVEDAIKVIKDKKEKK